MIVATAYTVGADTGRRGTIAPDAWPVTFYGPDGAPVMVRHYRLCRTARTAIDTAGRYVFHTLTDTGGHR
jgi:hypothetical protein